MQQKSLRAALIFSLATVLIDLAPATASDWFYTFRPGDTLWTVCREYTNEPGCWQKLGPINQIAADRRIAPGTRIRIPVDWLKVPPASAEVLFARGEVSIIEPGENPKLATAGAELAIGASIVTREGTATIGFADGSSIVLEAHSELALDALSNFELHGMVDSTVRLNKGTIKTRVIERVPRSRFKTVTPNAVAAVRGTEYRVSLAAPADAEASELAVTRIGVYEGLVDVGAEQSSYPVPATFGIVAKPNTPLQPPVKLLDPPIFLAVPSEYAVSVDEEGLQREGLTVSWQSLPDASTYQLNVLARSEPGSPEKLISTYTSVRSELTLTGLPVACYDLSLRAIDQQGLHGLNALAPVCLVERPLAPAFQMEQQDIEGGERLSIAWSEVPGAKHYRVELSEHADFSTLLREEITTEAAYILEHDSKLYVRVSAIDARNNSSLHSETLSWQPEVKDSSFWPGLIPAGMFLLGLILV